MRRARAPRSCPLSNIDNAAGVMKRCNVLLHRFHNMNYLLRHKDTKTWTNGREGGKYFNYLGNKTLFRCNTKAIRDTGF